MAKLNDRPKLDPVKDASPESLAEAQQAYAKDHRVNIEEAKKVEPIVLFGELYTRQAEVISDDLFKWRSMPYPVALAKAHDAVVAMQKLAADEPGNPFVPMVEMDKVISRFARVDRQIAALTAVEAIRSYAAANGGNLPQHLGDITETPAPANPATGKPFEYRVENDSATLTATELDAPLTYTIGIRR
jgi:hypothetical protein